MSEVPSGVDMPLFKRKPPRPSATLMITKQGDEGVEVLLGKRSESMPSFPGYWAFPGGEFQELTNPQVRLWEFLFNIVQYLER